MWSFPTAGSAEFLNPAEFTGLRNTSKTLPCLVTNATAFRSLASTHIFPNPIQGDAVASFENRMSDKDIAEAERVRRECGVTACRTLEISILVEFYLPKRSPSGIDIEEIALPIEG